MKDDIRIYTCSGHVVTKPSGAKTIYAADRFYLVDADTGSEMIGAGVAEPASPDNTRIQDPPPSTKPRTSPDEYPEGATVADSVPMGTGLTMEIDEPPSFRSVHLAAPVVHDEPTDDDDPTDEE